MNFGRLNQGRTYTVNGWALGNIVDQRNWVAWNWWHSSLKLVTQVDRVVLSFTSRDIKNNTGTICYNGTSQLESSMGCWSPDFRKNVIKLDEVQDKFSRMLPGMEDLNYKERLDRLGVFSLEQRILRGDLKDSYNIMDSHSHFLRIR